jgi:hypothetical protein
VEDDLCLVCRGLSGLWDETLRTSEDDLDPHSERWRLHAVAVESAHREFALRYALGPRDPVFGCWWCGRPGEAIAFAEFAAAGRDGADREEVAFASPVLCTICRDLLGATGGGFAHFERTVNAAMRRLVLELGHEPPQLL